MPTATLNGKRIAMLLTDGVEEVEYLQPRRFLEERSARVHLVAPKPAGDRVQGFRGLAPDRTFAVERSVDEVTADDYDALILPGGVANPDLLRLSDSAVGLVREFRALQRPVAAICHGPWLLIDAGLAEGRELTSWPSLRTDIVNAGGSWSDRPVVVDGHLVTSRGPDDIAEFTAQIERVVAAS